jgi:hypothetical protein
MLILPSVGATVKKIILNESATKAKIIYDDGSSTIVSTVNTPVKKVVNKVTKTPSGVSVVKRKVVRSESVGMPNMQQKSISNYPILTEKKLQQLESKRESVIEKAKKRAEMLGESTMTASERMGLNAEEGTSIDI